MGFEFGMLTHPNSPCLPSFHSSHLRRPQSRKSHFDRRGAFHSSREFRFWLDDTETLSPQVLRFTNDELHRFDFEFLEDILSSQGLQVSQICERPWRIFISHRPLGMLTTFSPCSSSQESTTMGYRDQQPWGHRRQYRRASSGHWGEMNWFCSLFFKKHILSFDDLQEYMEGLSSVKNSCHEDRIKSCLQELKVTMMDTCCVDTSLFILFSSPATLNILHFFRMYLRRSEPLPSMPSRGWFKASNSGSVPLLKSCRHATLNWVMTVTANKMTLTPGCSTCYWSATRLVYSVRNLLFQARVSPDCWTVPFVDVRRRLVISGACPIEIYRYFTLYNDHLTHHPLSAITLDNISMQCPTGPSSCPPRWTVLLVLLLKTSPIVWRFASLQYFLHCTSVVFFLLPVLVESLLCCYRAHIYGSASRPCTWISADSLWHLTVQGVVLGDLRFTQLGGLLFERSLRRIVFHFTSCYPQSSCRESFARVSQVALILTLEDPSETLDYWDQLTFRLSELEIKRVLNLRSDFRVADINALHMSGRI